MKFSIRLEKYSHGLTSKTNLYFEKLIPIASPKSYGILWVKESSKAFLFQELSEASAVLEVFEQADSGHGRLTVENVG